MYYRHQILSQFEERIQRYFQEAKRYDPSDPELLTLTLVTVNL
jgi:hypothetical protein